MCNNKNNDCSCIAEILTVICILQQSASGCDDCLDSCDRGFLGCSTACPSCNTRPVMLYTCTGNGEPWRMPTNRTTTGCEGTVTETSCVFRVEKIDGCCATFRVLAPNPDATEATVLPYVATNSLFTMDLNCCCALRCLPDTIIDCI